jgi:hypothetical protein
MISTSNFALQVVAAILSLFSSPLPSVNLSLLRDPVPQGGPASPLCPGGTEHLLGSDYLSIYASDGTQCHHWNIKNIADANSGSKQSVSVSWADGSSQVSEIGPGQSVNRECFVKLIQAKELFTGSSTLCLTQT